MMSFTTLFQEIRRGKTLDRIFINGILADIPVAGNIFDVAGGGQTRPASYRMRFMRAAPESHWITTDYDRALRPDVCFNAEHPWPTCDKLFDVVLMITCLHLFDPHIAISEAARVLKEHGRLIFSTSMILQESPEPENTYRFNSKSARLLVEHAGLVVEQILPIGWRFCCAVEILHPYLRRVWLYLPCALAAYLIDKHLTSRVAYEQDYGLHFGHIVVARKPG